ncbi:MAG: hypothetical protein AB1333_02285 [Patescibacteria group bacterium]
MINLPGTLRNRKKIQRERTVHDETIIHLAEQDFAPVREWLKHLKEKIPTLKKAVEQPQIHQRDNTPVASIPSELETLRERLMRNTLPGDAPAEEVLLHVNEKIVHEYFETISTYLPFYLFNRFGKLRETPKRIRKTQLIPFKRLFLARRGIKFNECV